MTISISVPDTAELIVDAGDLVDFNQPLYKLSEPELLSVNIAQELGINSIDMFSHLTKLIGETVSKGEVIAQKKSLFQHKKVASAVDGILTHIDHNNGEIQITPTVSRSLSEGTVNCFFKGRIETIDIVNKQIILSVENGIEINLKDCSQDGGGEIFILVTEEDFFGVNEDTVSGKVVVTEVLKPHYTAKCLALGVNGFIYLNDVDATDIVPGGHVAKKTDFAVVKKSQKKYILYSCLDKKAIIYN